MSALGFRLSVTSLHENEALFSCCTLVMPEFDSLFILVSSLAEAIPVLSEVMLFIFNRELFNACAGRHHLLFFHFKL